MEPPGLLPPDKDRFLIQQQQQQQQPSINTSTPIAANQITTSSSIGSVSTTSTGQQPIERLSRPMAFDKVSGIVIIIFFFSIL